MRLENWGLMVTNIPKWEVRRERWIGMKKGEGDGGGRNLMTPQATSRTLAGMGQNPYRSLSTQPVNQGGTRFQRDREESLMYRS